jgi:hypothetical protein
LFPGKLLGALLNSLNDRNAAVRKCYAAAIGNLVKVSFILDTKYIFFLYVELLDGSRKNQKTEGNLSKSTSNDNWQWHPTEFNPLP